MALLGIDVGTSGCKATLLDTKGVILGSAYMEYEAKQTVGTQAQIDPELVWYSVLNVIQQVMQKSEVYEMESIGVTSFGESVIFIDDQGQSLADSIYYYDLRGSEQVEWMLKNLDIEKFYQTTGVSPNATFSLAKIMWVRDNQPEVYRKTWKVLLFADFILFRLGAIAHSSPSLAARTMVYDVFNKRWAKEIIRSCNIDPALFADVMKSGSIAGELSDEVACKLGITNRPKLIVGGHDQVFAAIGAGAIGGGIAVDSIGTTECITIAFPRPDNLKTMNEAGFACVPFVLDDTYVTNAYTMTCGSILKWFRNYFVADWHEAAEKAQKNIYDHMIDQAIDSETDMLMLPHLAGSATPYMDNGSQGALIGLTLNTDRKEIIKAILESINFEMVVNAERLTEAGIEVKEVRVVGGLSRSDNFLQLKADIMGIPIIRVQTHEAGTLGVALVSSVAMGKYSSIEEAVAALVKTTDRFYPDPLRNNYYKAKFQRYKLLYPAVRPIVKSCDNCESNV